MNGFSAALRQAMKRSSPPSLAARRRFAKARTESSKNITPKREMIMSKLAGSNAWLCASAQMKRRRRALPFGARPGGGDHRLRDVDADAAASRAEPPRDGERRAARAAADVEHRLADRGRNLRHEQVLERLEASGRASPAPRPRRVRRGRSKVAACSSSVCCVAVHDRLLLAFERLQAALCHFKST